MDNNSLIVALISITAICELAGTVTVAINYYRAGNVARQIVNNYNPHLHMPFNEQKKTALLADQLTSRIYLTIGLIAYAFGTISGFLAGLASIYRWHF